VLSDGPRAAAGRAPAGAALVAPGEFSIVIAEVAADPGALDGELAALTPAYVLLMATLGPAAARIVEPVARAFRRKTDLREAVPIEDRLLEPAPSDDRRSPGPPFRVAQAACRGGRLHGPRGCEGGLHCLP
jgi:hypothetical protein